MVVALLLAAALATHTASAASSPPQRQIAQIEKRVGGGLGVAELDFAHHRRIEFRPNERFPMCSTFKFLAVAAVLRRVDRGTERLDRVLPYSLSDILEHAPVTKEHLSEGGLAVGALCEAALEQSDNTAANLLLKTIGGPTGLTKFVREIGDAETRLDRMEPALNSAIAGDERDTTTPAAMCQDLEHILLGDVLVPATRERLEGWMSKNTTGADLIRAGVPKTWRVGDKTGRGGNNATNDIAILHPPGRAPILLAIYSVGSQAPGAEGLRAIARVARAVNSSF